MLCLWAPDWPVVTARLVDPALAGVPVAVLDRGLVLCASDEARRSGVVRGLRRREAESRCPGLVTVATDPAAAHRAFEAVVEAVEVLAPRCALDRPGLLFVPTRGPSRYFGGDGALAERLMAAALAPPRRSRPGSSPSTLAGMVTRVGVADGTFAARLAARAAGPGAVVVVPPGESRAFLAAWPVAVLDDPALAGLLVRLGLTRLGDFAALPAGSVLGRFGAAGLAAHRRARGEEEYPPEMRVPPPEWDETTRFDPPEARVDTAVFCGRTLAERLVSRLGAEGLTCTRVRVEAETEHGERLTRTWRLEGPRAVTGPGLLADRVRGQLEAWVTRGERDLQSHDEGTEVGDEVTGGLTLLRLVPDEVVLAGRSQLGLWGGDRAAAERAARALVRVQSLLSPEAVVTPLLRGGRTPAERVEWVPFGEDGPGAGEDAPWPGTLPAPAPAVVFDPGRPAALLDAAGEAVAVSARGLPSGTPVCLRCDVLVGGGGPVEGWAGPWLHDVRWWDRAAHRRRAWWQVVAAGAACLVATEGGRAFVEGLYD